MGGAVVPYLSHNSATSEYSLFHVHLVNSARSEGFSSWVRGSSFSCTLIALMRAPTVCVNFFLGLCNWNSPYCVVMQF